LYFIQKWINKVKFSIKKWKNICEFTLIINETIKRIDYQWSSISRMLLFRQLFTCFRFLLIMNLNREWASIRWNSTKTRQEIESTNSEEKKSSSLWRIFEYSLKNIWKKVNKVKLFMLTNIKFSRQIIK
jgi:hypothetical protein